MQAKDDVDRLQQLTMDRSNLAFGSVMVRPCSRCFSSHGEALDSAPRQHASPSQDVRQASISSIPAAQLTASLASRSRRTHAGPMA